jgi:hypothetical protein
MNLDPFTRPNELSTVIFFMFQDNLRQCFSWNLKLLILFQCSRHHSRLAWGLSIIEMKILQTLGTWRWISWEVIHQHDHEFVLKIQSRPLHSGVRGCYEETLSIVYSDRIGASCQWIFFEAFSNILRRPRK